MRMEFWTLHQRQFGFRSAVLVTGHDSDDCRVCWTLECALSTAGQ